MAFEVVMPSMGEGITEATLVRWLKKPGDAVKKEEPLLEVSTDKVDTEIPAPAEGFLLETLADAGSTVEVNSVIAKIGATATDTAKESKEKPTKEAKALAPKAIAGATANSSTSADRKASAAAAASTTATDSGTATRSSPLVRKMAKEHAVDLSSVPGTGLGGRITRADIEAHLKSGGSSAKQAPATDTVELGRVKTTQQNGRELLEGVVVRREKMSKIRRLTAEHMVRSVRTSPHVTTVFEIDFHKVTQSRQKYLDAFAKQEGFKLTLTHYILRATVRAIQQHPIVNCSVDGDDILHKDSINLGCAVAIESGLIVPVIKDAGSLSLLGVARKLNDLVTRARTKKLLAEDVQGGTFSITNPGMFGSVISAPIINQPQVAILSVGAIIKRPVVIDDLIGVRPLCQIGLTFDHRVIDGEGGAKFLATLKETIENFNESPL